MLRPPFSESSCSRRRVSRRRARFHDALVHRDRRRVTFSTSKRTSPRRGTERATPEPLLFLNPVDARGENVMTMMSDDDDYDDYDANERTLSRWRARISRGKRIAIIGTRSVEPRFTRVSFAGRERRVVVESKRRRESACASSTSCRIIYL